MSALINSLRLIKSRNSSYTMTPSNITIATKSSKLWTWNPNHWFNCQFQILSQICRLWLLSTTSWWILVRSFNSSKLINLQGIDTSIAPKKYSGGLDRNSLKVGDRVGWHSKLGHDLYGVVEKLNPKKALVRLGNGEQWTVSYSLLFLVMDGFSVQGAFGTKPTKVGDLSCSVLN